MSVLDYSHPLIMGILNLTPDSFSDGDKFPDSNSAVDHALCMVKEGVDIIDVGGESTRPNSERISAAEQIKRTAETISVLHRALPKEILISIDTTLSEVAEAGLKAGASIINDISAGRDDPEIMKLAAQNDCPYIIMHMQGNPQTMQDNPNYDDVVGEIKTFLLERAECAQSIGIKKENIIVDPGIGFGKTEKHNLEIICNLEQLVSTGFPVLLGTSRKRFMGAICKNTDPEQLIGATCATTVIGVNAGVKLFRVHDVRPNCQAAEVTWAIKTHRNN